MTKPQAIRWDTRRETWLGRIRGADGKLTAWRALGTEIEGVARKRVEHWQETGELIDMAQPEPAPEDMDESPELTREDFEAMLSGTQRKRIEAGELKPGDVAALRRFVQLSQAQFAEALGISVRTLQNWEQDRVRPDGPGLALLRIAARSPSMIRKNLASVA